VDHFEIRHLPKYWSKCFCTQENCFFCKTLLHYTAYISWSLLDFFFLSLPFLCHIHKNTSDFLF